MRILPKIDIFPTPQGCGRMDSVITFRVELRQWRYMIMDKIAEFVSQRFYECKRKSISENL